jgi:hypothetical protein
LSPAPELARLIDPTRLHHTGSSRKLTCMPSTVWQFGAEIHGNITQSFEQGKDNLLLYCRIRGRRRDDDAELQKIVSLAQEAVRVCREDVEGAYSPLNISGATTMGLLGLKRSQASNIDPQRRPHTS